MVKRKGMILGVFLTLALVLSVGASCSTGSSNPDTKPHFSEQVNAHLFYKGNIHTHTDKSDGHAPPETVAQWYHKRGYRFLAITDHDLLTPSPIPDTRDFITIPGVEVTGSATGQTPVHANAICGHSALVGPKGEIPVPQLLNEIIQLIRNDDALSLINHPNFHWAIHQEDLLATDGFEMLEIASGHPEVHDDGDETHPSSEELWDAYLTKKHKVYGVAVDDAHDYEKFAPTLANPGRAWIQAWGFADLNKAAVCDALRQGHFYSSNGSKLNGLLVTANRMEVVVDGWQPSHDRVDFIGANGQLLASETSNPARYVVQGGEGYVRAHVCQGDITKAKLHACKKDAWTQAYYVKYD